MKIRKAFPEEAMMCSRGCWRCCELDSVCALEAAVIFSAMPAGSMFSAEDDHHCPFLTDGICGIYSDRPLICRTHGLPLRSASEENPRIHHCESNFTGIAIPDSLVLDEKIPATNLARLNIAFGMILGDPSIADTRIGLRQLCAGKVAEPVRVAAELVKGM
jgi:Fe-S-cluster containining protein